MQSLWKGKLVMKEGAVGKEKKKGKEKKLQRKSMGGEYHNAMENIKIAEEILKSHMESNLVQHHAPNPPLMMWQKQWLMRPSLLQVNQEVEKLGSLGLHKKEELVQPTCLLGPTRL
jgi:hypothetical protein